MYYCSGSFSVKNDEVAYFHVLIIYSHVLINRQEKQYKQNAVVIYFEFKC